MEETMDNNNLPCEDKEGFNLIKFYSYSLLKLFQPNLYTDMMTDWKKASILLNVYSIKNKTEKIFPLILDDQIEIIKKTINNWGIGFYEEFDGVDIPLIINIGGEWNLTDLALDLAKHYDKSPGAEDLEELKKIVSEAGLNNQIYTKMRELLIRNSVIPEKKLPLIQKELNHLVNEDSLFALEEIFKTNNLFDIFESQYDLVLPNEIVDNKLELCPYCGYLLQTVTKRNYAGERDKHYFCLTSKCLSRKDVSERKVIEVKKGEQYYKVKKQILYSVVNPGVIEIEVYEKLLKESQEYGFNIELYPGADKADLLIRFKNGEEWAIDIKDWNNPNDLANSLNIKGFLKGILTDPNFNIKLAFLVLPDDVKDGYINRLKARWDKSDQYSILRVKELMKRVKSGVSK
jgi:hypothetical protein